MKAPRPPSLPWAGLGGLAVGVRPQTQFLGFYSRRRWWACMLCAQHIFAFLDLHFSQFLVLERRQAVLFKTLFLNCCFLDMKRICQTACWGLRTEASIHLTRLSVHFCDHYSHSYNIVTIIFVKTSHVYLLRPS